MVDEDGVRWLRPNQVADRWSIHRKTVATYADRYGVRSRTLASGERRYHEGDVQAALDMMERGERPAPAGTDQPEPRSQ